MNASMSESVKRIFFPIARARDLAFSPETLNVSFARVQARSGARPVVKRCCILPSHVGSFRTPFGQRKGRRASGVTGERSLRG